MNLSHIANRIPPFLRNKYLFTIVVFVLWLLFFDKTNVISWLGEEAKIKSMKNQKEYYQKEIESISTQLNLLNTDNESLERFAREHYYLKKEGEEIYLIEE